MASSNNSENVLQSKTFRGEEGDTNPDKQTNKCPNSDILKSGPLFVSSKGIGWTSWKKRWFVLTRTSLVFYRVDPDTLSQKGNETNPTLGGIDLNNSGSVDVKADKKLLTVFFPDGRDGRTINLKTETSEDLYEWKTALENALAQAPSAALAMGQHGRFQNDMTEQIEVSDDQCTEKEPAQSMGVGTDKENSTVFMLELEDIDGNPSFLEKALTFIEQHGVKVEGILRQSADVEEVKRRLREYEQGKVDFSSDEDAHVIGDCIKYVLRELPSSPVPATCCTALVEAYRTDRGKRVDAIRSAIYDTFPDPNLRLMQRILKMMQKVAVHKSQNLMSLSALAACMAPLLLRPLLAGDCEFEDDFNMAGDGSIQLMKAAAAANHAQVIVIILLEEFDKIFDEDLLDSGSELYTDSEYDEVDDDDGEDDDLTDDDNPEDGDHDENSNDESTENGIPEDGVSCEDHKSCDGLTDVDIPGDDGHHDEHNRAEVNIDGPEQSDSESLIDNQKREGASLQEGDETLQSGNSNEAVTSSKKPTVWGRATARKNLSMESIDLPDEEEAAIQKLEGMMSDLKNKIAKEEKGNAMLKESLVKRKEALNERRLVLEQEVERLQEKLRTERDLRHMQPRDPSFSSVMDSKKVADLHGQLDHQPKQSHASLCESCGKHLHTTDRSAGKNQVENAGSTGLVGQSKQASIAANTKNVRAQSQDPVSASDGQPSQRTNTANQSTTVSRGSGKAASVRESAKVGGISVSRQPLTSEDFKKDAQDTSQPKQSPIMQWPSSTALNILKAPASNGVSSPEGGSRKVSPRAEDSPSSSSSALAKLTNRLNFLKERRAQLASGTTGSPPAPNARTSGPDGSPTS